MVEQQGITAAARYLKISPAAVSKHIKALEEHFNLKLLRLAKRGPELTDEGRLFLNKAKLVFEQIRELEETMALLNGKPQGVLRIFSTVAFGEHFLIPFLRYFQNLYPALEINLVMDDRIPDPQTEGFDILLGLAGHWKEDLIQKKLFSTCYLLCAAPEYLRAHSPIRTIKDLYQQRFMAPSHRPDSKILFSVKGKEIEVKLTPLIKASSGLALLQLAEQGQGLVNLYDFVVAASMEKGFLEQVLPQYEQPPQNIYCFYSRSSSRQSKVRAFLEDFAAFLKKGRS